MVELMIAAPASGSGKTVLACALLGALKGRGLNPCAFKCGPDYIDPMFHRAALGVDSRVECDVDRLEPGEGSRLLLCSDGLSNVLEDETILALSGREGEPEGFCRALVELTLERGAPDNVTAVLVKR